MKLDPKADVRFQAAIQNILATVHTTYGADLLIDDVATRTLVGNLIDLRTDFIIAVWTHSQLRKALHKKTPSDSCSEVQRRNTPTVQSEEEKGSFEKFASLRDSKEA